MHLPQRFHPRLFPHLRLLLVLLLSLGGGSMLASAQTNNLLLLGTNDKPSPFYAPGEPMRFEVRLMQDGQQIGGKTLQWTRSGDDGLSEQGQAVASAEEPLVIVTSSDAPGFVRILVHVLDDNGEPILNANKRKIAFDGGGGVQPEKLHGIAEPADFDAWWQAQKALLAQTPMQVLEQTKLPDTHPNVETWDVKVACPGPVASVTGTAAPASGQHSPRPVSGYLSKTRGAAPGSAAAQINFHGYGVRSAIRRDKDANDPNNPKIILDINVHGIENGQPDAFYEELAKTDLRGYGFHGETNKDPQSAYFYGVVMRVLRALEFIKSQPEWDGKTLVVSGGSQGAFQALLAAGLDADVTRCNAWKPWLCDLGGVTLGRLKGWRPEYTPALAYFDPINHAKRISAETFITSGLGDYVCPPSGVTALYNSIPAQTPKRIEYQQGATHGESPPNGVRFNVSNKQ